MASITMNAYESTKYHESESERNFAMQEYQWDEMELIHRDVAVEIPTHVVFFSANNFFYCRLFEDNFFYLCCTWNDGKLPISLCSCETLMDETKACFWSNFKVQTVDKVFLNGLKSLSSQVKKRTSDFKMFFDWLKFELDMSNH